MSRGVSTKSRLCQSEGNWPLPSCSCWNNVLWWKTLIQIYELSILYLISGSFFCKVVVTILPLFLLPLAWIWCFLGAIPAIVGGGWCYYLCGALNSWESHACLTFFRRQLFALLSRLWDPVLHLILSGVLGGGRFCCFLSFYVFSFSTGWPTYDYNSNSSKNEITKIIK